MLEVSPKIGGEKEGYDMKKTTILKILGGTTAAAAIGTFAFLQIAPVSANAATIDYGSGAALADDSYTVEEMLTYAIQDEFLALATYDAVINTFGEVRVFVNLEKAETTHVAELETLITLYNVAPVENLASSYVVTPESLPLAYEALIAAENGNIAMYDAFLATEGLPEDVAATFTALRDASVRHLAAGTRASTSTGLGNGSGKGSGQGSGNKGGSGTGTCDGTGSGKQSGGKGYGQSK